MTDQPYARLEIEVTIWPNTKPTIKDDDAISDAFAAAAELTRKRLHELDVVHEVRSDY